VCPEGTDSQIHNIRTFINTVVPKEAANKAPLDFQRAEFRRQELQALAEGKSLIHLLTAARLWALFNFRGMEIDGRSGIPGQNYWGWQAMRGIRDGLDR
jgi:hypothetical protein